MKQMHVVINIHKYQTLLSTTMTINITITSLVLDLNGWKSDHLRT